MMQKSSGDPNYYLQPDKNIRKQDIAYAAGDLDRVAAELWGMYALNPNVNNTREYRGFAIQFKILYNLTFGYLEEKLGKEYKDQMRHIEQAFNTPNRHTPKILLNAHHEYIRVLIKNGILDIGYKGRPLEDRMFD